VTDVASLLPPDDATPLELTIEQASAPAASLPVEIARLNRGETAPLSAVPFLAWGRSVDLWSDDWTDGQKRSVVDQFFDLHRYKGTLGGIERHVALTPGRVIDAVVPPQAFFLGGNNDDELWRRWMDRLPEIRLYTLREPETDIGLFGYDGLGEDFDLPTMFLGEETADEPTFFFSGDVPLEVAKIVRGDTEEPIGFTRGPDTRIGRTGEVYAFYWSRPAGFGLFVDDAASADRYLDGEPAEQAYVAINFAAGQVSEGWNLAVPSPYVQDVTAITRSVGVEDTVGIYVDDFIADRFFDSEDNVRGTYKSIRVMDTVEDFFSPSSFLDYDRFEMPAYNAELVTMIPGYGPPRDFFFEEALLDDVFIGPDTDLSDVHLVCTAVDVSKSLRDRVLLDLDVSTKRSFRLARTWADFSLR